MVHVLTMFGKGVTSSVIDNPRACTSTPDTRCGRGEACLGRLHSTPARQEMTTPEPSPGSDEVTPVTCVVRGVRRLQLRPVPRSRVDWGAFNMWAIHQIRSQIDWHGKRTILCNPGKRVS